MRIRGIHIRRRFHNRRNLAFGIGVLVFLAIAFVAMVVALIVILVVTWKPGSQDEMESDLDLPSSQASQGDSELNYSIMTGATTPYELSVKTAVALECVFPTGTGGCWIEIRTAPQRLGLNADCDLSELGPCIYPTISSWLLFSIESVPQAHWMTRALSDYDTSGTMALGKVGDGNWPDLYGRRS